MIPLKLHIKNFLSYGSEVQIIDFEPYHMICLSGKNGHGKSALLDAITWAIWGQARKITGAAKADEGLLRLGQSQMMVQLSFICNGQTYQVRREYNKSSYGKAYINLDFGMFDPEKQNFVPVGGKSVRAGQTAIDGIVRLDFDSFCNSAFLRQGQSNEFSKKSAKERKEVLGSILGLGQYEAIRKLASDKGREASSERIAVAAVLDRTKQELETMPTLLTSLAAIKEQLASLATEETILSTQWNELQEFHNQCKQEEQQMKLLSAVSAELSEKKNQLVESFHAAANQWRSIHKEQLQCASGTQWQERRQELLNELNKQQEHMQQGLALREQLLDYKQRLHEREQWIIKEGAQQLQEQQISLERAIIESRGVIEKLNGLEKNRASLEHERKQLMQDLEAFGKQIHESSEQCKDIDALSKQFEKRKAFYQQMITEGNMLQHELDNLAHKQLLSQDEANPSCPLCEQNLSVARRRFMKAKFAKDENFMRHRIDRIARIIQRLKILLINSHDQLIKREQAKQACHTAEVQREQGQKKLASIMHELSVINEQYQEVVIAVAASKERIKNEQEKVDTFAQNLAKQQSIDKECEQLRAMLISLEASIAKHGDDTKIVADIRMQLVVIEQQMIKYQELIKQSALQEQRMRDVSNQGLQIKKCTSELHERMKQLESMANLSSKQKEIEARKQIWQESSKELATRKESLLQEKGSLENQQKKLQALDAEFIAHQKRLKEIDDRLDDLQAIIAATGKDGIQALLIQDVLPEIEQEANLLIAKLTDNQSQIFIESLRDLKKGGTKETLDINISDGLGIRPYEMFSGGEAFRIDFALRIAMSKLLARRAGTTLQTLIIDEGFGSQDEDGLASIMDALGKIQDDFAKVIIVSHLPSMKDQFPVQFYVEKKPTGSMVNVIEQG